MHYEIRIQAGWLRLDIQREDMPLEILLGFASRQNPKRGYLFVSKVLGKHIPCRPSLMRQVYDRLAEQLSDLDAPVTLIGMAETATGLGAGVAHSLACGNRQNRVLYLHTTRYRLPTSVLITFDENHSHAPDHILYAPYGEGADLFKRTSTLVLVDDEISTGRTLSLLARRIAVHMPKLRRIVLVSLVNWLDTVRCGSLLSDLPQEISFISLLQGTFEFRPDPTYRPVLPAGTRVGKSSRAARMDTGRTGLLMPLDARWNLIPLTKITGALSWRAKSRTQASVRSEYVQDSTSERRWHPAQNALSLMRFGMRSFPADGPLVVVGTGEFTFAPFLAAEELEQRGHDVLFQSTTRSPVMPGDAIVSKMTFPDEYNEGVTNYIYNLPLDRQVIVAYEDSDLAIAHDFPAMVDGQVWALA